ncbi:unnamed protein product (macronuclear) [Paramecium tetraurelia]|uniref:Uncharacterized protein n=1 Tax=Paramecium tetraurelia TaxID=5888 RepID=A0DR82_PARTE|nr:uncharacterized protein GSPATT00019266001 [Paramecium tetraurelia]CAK85549.1 unnamed protein product [Paramecium tetraurelia]|eukprot:XP_001452946.1 hypothetical protein (macronuclear) [Paramecium tetraurelia strain d4-2]
MIIQHKLPGQLNTEKNQISPNHHFSEYFTEFKNKRYCKAKRINPPQEFKDKNPMFKLESTKQVFALTFTQIEYYDKTTHHLVRPQTACLPDNKRIKECFSHNTTYQKLHDEKPNCIATIYRLLVDEPYQLKLDYPQTIMEGTKLDASSEYQRQYRSLTPEKDLIFGGKSIFNNPISPNVALFRQSESHRFFKSIKIKQHRIVQPSLAKKLALDTSLTIPNIPTFLGQYETVSKRDFSEKKIKEIPKRFKFNQQN